MPLIGVDANIISRTEEIAKGFERFTLASLRSFFAKNSAQDFLYNLPNTNLAKKFSPQLPNSVSDAKNLSFGVS